MKFQVNSLRIKPEIQIEQAKYRGKNAVFLFSYLPYVL